MILTMLTAPVPDGDTGLLTAAFERSTAELPPSIAEVFLLHDRGSDTWRIAALWRSADELAAYQASVDVPEGIKMFRSAGVEPSLSAHDVVRRASHATDPSAA